MKKTIERKTQAVLPTDFGDFQIIVFQSLNDLKEHVVLVKGEIDFDKPVLMRIHCECLTGEVFHSQRCDCDLQLDASLRAIEENASGMLLYLRQEGRGIGLINKIKAYALQDLGLDTVDANEKLGFQADMRNYDQAVEIIKDFGISRVRLMTNNPFKIKSLEENGIQVERVAIEMPVHKNNENYLLTKKKRLGHLFKNV